jgi:hypothetical protein
LIFHSFGILLQQTKIGFVPVGYKMTVVQMESTTAAVENKRVMGGGAQHKDFRVGPRRAIHLRIAVFRC